MVSPIMGGLRPSPQFAHPSDASTKLCESGSYAKSAPAGVTVAPIVATPGSTAGPSAPPSRSKRMTSAWAPPLTEIQLTIQMRCAGTQATVGCKAAEPPLAAMTTVGPKPRSSVPVESAMLCGEQPISATTARCPAPSEAIDTARAPFNPGMLADREFAPFPSSAHTPTSSSAGAATITCEPSATTAGGRIETLRAVRVAGGPTAAVDVPAKTVATAVTSGAARAASQLCSGSLRDVSAVWYQATSAVVSP